MHKYLTISKFQSKLIEATQLNLQTAKATIIFHFSNKFDEYLITVYSQRIDFIGSVRKESMR